MVAAQRSTIPTDWTSKGIDPDSLTYQDFRRMAEDPSLSRYEKVGLPDNYRHSKSDAIFRDIARKMPVLRGAGLRVLEIGPGCTPLPFLFIEACLNHMHELTLMDSPEMLALLPDDGVVKFPGEFPKSQPQGQFDAILCYSVLQCVPHPTEFLLAAAEMLAPGAEMLFGDLPNGDMRRRNNCSPTGSVQFSDNVLTGWMLMLRDRGFVAYLMDQPSLLPFSDRREDLYARAP